MSTKVRMEKDFESKIPTKVMALLLDLGTEIGFDATSSTDAEKFFLRLMDQFSGTPNDFPAWLRREVSNSFICFKDRPKWIQNPAWPFTDRGPMMFIGQMDLPSGLFHDSASFYIFYEPKSGVTDTILQIA
jgi:hypothetical protein